MKKVLIGLALGAILGILDGSTAWFEPAEREFGKMMGIIGGSVFKGVLTGLAAGLFARKIHSEMKGLFFGLVISSLLSWGVAYMIWVNEGKNYYVNLLLPGAIVGAIVGYATQKLPKQQQT